jgi:hypothetical protein
MAPSTNTPMEMAMPAKDMMLVVKPMKYMGMNAKHNGNGDGQMGMIADGMCHRKRRITKLTMIISSVSSSFRVAMARWMRSDRS